MHDGQKYVVADIAGWINDPFYNYYPYKNIFVYDGNVVYFGEVKWGDR